MDATDSALPVLAAAPCPTGYCSLGIMCQNLENPQLRRALGMPQGMTGVLVNTIQPTSAAAKVGRKDIFQPAWHGGCQGLRVNRTVVYFHCLCCNADPARLQVIKHRDVLPGLEGASPVICRIAFFILQF